MRVARLWKYVMWAGVAAIALMVPAALWQFGKAPTAPPPIIVSSDRPSPEPSAIDLPSTTPPASGAPPIGGLEASARAQGRETPADLSGAGTKQPNAKIAAKLGADWSAADAAKFRDFMKLNQQGEVVTDVMAQLAPPGAAPIPTPTTPISPPAARPPAPPRPAPMAQATASSARVAEAEARTAAQPDDAACRETERSLGIYNPGPCIDIGRMVARLARGKYHFNKPKKAYLGEPFRLTLVLQTVSDQDVSGSFGGTQGEVVVREGKFAQSLEATLRADDLKVDPAGPQPRTATLAEPVEWSWTLTPQTEGEKRLVIEVAANLHVGTDQHKVQVTTLREAIVIQVGVLQRIKLYVAEINGLVVAITGLITALVGLVGLVPPVRRFVLKLFGSRDTTATS